jgi:hypothetical protein
LVGLNAERLFGGGLWKRSLLIYRNIRLKFSAASALMTGLSFAKVLLLIYVVRGGDVEYGNTWFSGCSDLVQPACQDRKIIEF